MLVSAPAVEVVALTHRGALRESNEDSLVVGAFVSSGSMRVPLELRQTLESPLICAVADGLGGHEAGEVASQYVARRLSESASLLEDRESLGLELERISAELRARTPRAGGSKVMGSTVAGIILSSTSTLFFNVGDSRIYREQEGFLRQLSTDDRVEVPPLTERARRSNVVTQALGGSMAGEGIAAHVDTERFVQGRRYLVCSDGVTDMVSLESMERCLCGDDGAAVQCLFEAAMSAGGRDNISLLMIRLLGAEPS